MKIALSKYLDVSTGHITAEDGIRINNPKAPYHIGELDAGIGSLFYVPALDVCPDDEIIRALSIFGFSPAFANIFLLARSKGARMIRFDADGDDHDLPTFDW